MTVAARIEMVRLPLPIYFAAVVLIVAGLVGHLIVMPRRARVARACAIAAMPLLLLFGIGPWMAQFGFAAAILIAFVAVGGFRAGTWPGWASTAVVLGVLGVVVIVVVGLNLKGLDRMSGGVLFVMAALCLVPVWLGVGGSLITGAAPVRIRPA